MNIYRIAEVALKFWIIMIFSLLLVGKSIYAQKEIADLSGVVKEAGSGEVLIGANLLLYSDSLKINPPLRGVATNKFGFYAMPGISLGEYYLAVSVVGYESQTQSVVFSRKNQAVRIDFNLEKKSILLGEVVIQSSRETDFSSIPNTIEVNPEVVKLIPSIGGEADIFRSLLLLPGVTAATEISTGIYVRGGSPDQNLTLIDGLLVYNPAHLGGFASTFNSDALQDIKLMKGAFPAEYGGRISSVLDVTMREGSKEKFMGALSLNLISTRLTLEGPLDDKSTFILSGRKMFLDKILPVIPKTSNIPRYNFYDFNGKVNYTISEKDRIYVNGFFSQDNIIEPPANEDVGFDISWSNATANLTWTSINSPTMFSNTSLMYTNYEFSTLIKDKMPEKDPLDFFTSSFIHDFVLKRDMQIFPSSKHTLKIGAEVIYHDFSTTTSDYFIKELKYKPIYGTTINALEAAFYFQDDWKPNEDFKTNFGCRIYYFKNASFLAIEPRISITYYLTDRLVLRSAFAITNQTIHQLSRQDVYLPTDVWYPSTSIIKPAKSVQGSFGLEATSVEKTFLFSMESYIKQMKNLYEYREAADFSFGNEFELQITNGTGIAYGIEMFLHKRIGEFTGWVSYTLAWTRREFENLNRGQSFYPRFDRRHDISAVVLFQPSQSFSLGATWTYGTGQAYFLPIGQYSIVGLNNPFSNQENIYYEYSARDAFRLEAFHKLDLSCKYLTSWLDYKIEISVDIYNAYNKFNPFSKYIGYKLDPVTAEKIPILKQFTLFPFLPTIGITINF